MVCAGQINWNFIWIMKLAHAQQAEFFCIKRFLIRFFFYGLRGECLKLPQFGEWRKRGGGCDRGGVGLSAP